MVLGLKFLYHVLKKQTNSCTPACTPACTPEPSKSPKKCVQVSSLTVIALKQRVLFNIKRLQRGNYII